jgi:hypothetical protein
VSAKSVLTLGFILCLVMAITSVSAENNQLVNPGFEDATDAPWLAGWWGGYGYSTDEEARTGERSWKMTGGGKPERAYPSPAASEHRQPLSVEVRGEGVGEDPVCLS